MKVASEKNYILVASRGGAPNHPVWYYNLKSNPSVTIQDGTYIHQMRAREIISPAERRHLWTIAVKAYPLYQDYQNKAGRVIPIFLAEGVSQES
jgi:deazaflavin-dependent oxidoreductase (nitroreductase family)